MSQSEVVPSQAFIAVAVLALIGIGTVVFVMLRTRDLKLRPTSAIRALVASLWLLPAIGATAYVVRQAVPHFDPAVAEVRSYDTIQALRTSEDGLVDGPTSDLVSVGPQGLIELRSKPWATPDEAIHEVRRTALDVLDAAFRPDYPYELARGDFAQQVLERAVAGQSVEPTQHRTETAKFQMHVARLTLDISPLVRNAYAQVWQTRIAEIRMVVLGGLTALAILIVIAAAAYFRLDLTTQGAYRRRLKLAAVSIVVAGALALAQVHPFQSPHPRIADGEHEGRIAQVDTAGPRA